MGGRLTSTARSGPSDDAESNRQDGEEVLKLRTLSSTEESEEPDGQDELSTNLRKAAAAHDVDGVNECLGQGAEPATCDEMGRNALHYACRLEVSKETKSNVEQILTLLLKRGCNRVNWIDDTDRKGHTALYYAIKYRNSTAAVKLVEGGANFGTGANEQVNTALHEACLAGLLDVVEKMLHYAPSRGPKPVNWKGHKNATPLHAACKNSNRCIVESLIQKGADIFAEDDVGETPLHAAASGLKVHGTIETVNYLLKHGAMEILNKATSEEESVRCSWITMILSRTVINLLILQKTPLSIACFYGQHETVKFLLSKGAVVDTKCMKFAVNKDFRFTARELVRSSQWQKCLRTTLPSGEPILNAMIRRMPEVALDVLDKCTVQHSHNYDDEGCVAFNFEFLECFREKRASFRVAQQQTYEDHDDLTEHHAKKDIAQEEKEYKDVTKQPQTWFGPDWGLKTFRKSQHPLSAMVKYGDKRYACLLTHPVVRALLHYKWWYLGFWCYVANFLLFLLFLAFATSFSLSVGNPLSPDCPMQGNGTCSLTERRKNGVISLAFLTILLAVFRLVLRIVKEIMLMYKLRKKYFTIYVLFDWMDVPSYLLTITFAMIFHYDCPCPQEWQWQVGIIGLFFAWLTLLKFANKLPFIGKYVLMLGRIVETFGKVAFTIGIPLIVAFAWPFYMALYDPEVMRSPFQNAAIAIVKVLSMTTGNFDYDNTFRRDSSMESESVTELPYLPATYILWITFIILMPLLLNNLLVGLAVGDIKSVEEKAELRELKLKAELILELEELMPPCLRARLRCGHKVVHPWKRQRIEWLRPKHKSPVDLMLVLKRRKHFQNQTLPNNKQTTEQGKDQQARLERLEDILERMANAWNININ